MRFLIGCALGLAMLIVAALCALLSGDETPIAERHPGH